jgi:hypothetical protein
MTDPADVGLESLLDLDGITFRLNEGFWVKFEAHRVEPSEQIPHGVSYSVTLHDRSNERVIGFDNAHGCPKPKRKKFGGRKITWDHRHREEKIVLYEYASAAQLIEDFWTEVDRVLEGGKP